MALGGLKGFLPTEDTLTSAVVSIAIRDVEKVGGHNGQLLGGCEQWSDEHNHGRSSRRKLSSPVVIRIKTSDPQLTDGRWASAQPPRLVRHVPTH